MSALDTAKSVSDNDGQLDSFNSNELFLRNVPDVGLFLIVVFSYGQLKLLMVVFSYGGVSSLFFHVDVSSVFFHVMYCVIEEAS